MIILLGATGYIGRAFALELQRRGWDSLACSRAKSDYTRYEVLTQLLRTHRATFLINAAGYTGQPNVDACEDNKADTLLGNALLPQTIAQACAAVGVPWGHVSSGCIYSGAKVRENDRIRVERDLMCLNVRSLVEQSPESIHGFTEEDDPNFSFRCPPCSFYSGTKALCEEVLHPFLKTYVWRLRIPFDEFDSPRNYLTKLQSYPRVYDNVNSLSHRGDFVRACLDLWERRAPFGIYNITNPGFVTTRQVVTMIKQVLQPAREFEFWSGDDVFYREGARTPRSNCVLDTGKLETAGVLMRPVSSAVLDALRLWQ